MEGEAMRGAGRGSWRFATGVSQLPHAALFVRDALHLAVAEEVLSPPRLRGELPDLTRQVLAETRSRAAIDWPLWWADLLALEVRKDEVVDDRERRQRVHELSQLVDPPEWVSLEDR